MSFIYSSLRALCECCVKVGHGVRVEGAERGRESLCVCVCVDNIPGFDVDF